MCLGVGTRDGSQQSDGTQLGGIRGTVMEGMERHRALTHESRTPPTVYFPTAPWRQRPQRRLTSWLGLDRLS